MNRVKVSKVVIEIADQVITLDLKDARELYEELSRLFSKDGNGNTISIPLTSPLRDWVGSYSNYTKMSDGNNFKVFMQ